MASGASVAAPVLLHDVPSRFRDCANAYAYVRHESARGMLPALVRMCRRKFVTDPAHCAG